jgi:hypothetical protein
MDVEKNKGRLFRRPKLTLSCSAKRKEERKEGRKEGMKEEDMIRLSGVHIVV